MTVVFATFEALFVALSNFTAGVASRRWTTVSTLMVAAPISLVTTMLASIFFPGTPSIAATGWGILAGIAGVGGLFVAYRALALGPIGAVAACIQCATTIVVAFSGILLTGGLTPMRSGALVLSLIAIILICLVPPKKQPRADVRRSITRQRGIGPMLGVVGGVLYGAFIVLAGQAPPGSGLWTVIPARITMTLVVLTAAWITARTRERSVPPSPGTVWMASAAGLTDGAATVSLALALLSNDLVLLALVGACAPALSAILGTTVLKERLSRWQIAGLLTAVLGASMAVT